MSNKLKADKWAMKAIEYLVRMNFSSQEVIDAMAEEGIRYEGKKDATNQIQKRGQ